MRIVNPAWGLLGCLLLCLTSCTPNENAGTESENGVAEVVSQQPKDPAEQRLVDDAQVALNQSSTEEVADDDSSEPDEVEIWQGYPEGESGPAELTIELSDDWTQVSPQYEVWVNRETSQVMIGGKVCLNTGPLEMFICPRGTKEHESVMSANVVSSLVHASLLAVGIQPGSPASWDPDYHPAYGPEMKIQMKWKDPETGEVQSRMSQEMIKNMKDGQPMKAKWVFGGSVFYENPDTGQRSYLGDSGELVCLSNFSTATIDINVPSSQDNENLLYEANTDNIPALGTQIYAIFSAGPQIGSPPEPKLAGPEDGESVKEPAETDEKKAPAGSAKSDNPGEEDNNGQ